MIPVPLGQTVTVVSRVAAAPDSFGNDTFTETTLAVPNCVVWPPIFRPMSSLTENTANRDTVTTGLWVLFPPGTNVRAIDRVLVNAISYEVEGDPDTHISPLTGTDIGVLATLKKVTG